jgi:hypothetical protein
MINKVKVNSEEKKLNAHVGEHVGYELGAKMVKDYHDKYHETSYQFIGKNILNEILSQPGCIGIHILKALNESGEKTYVILGVNEDGSPIFQYPAVNTCGELKIQEGIVADRNVEVPGWSDFLK